MIKALDELSSNSILAEQWIENLIKPAFLTGGWFWATPCQLQNDNAIFICSKTFQLCQIRHSTMERLPSDVMKEFLDGEHVMRHTNKRFEECNLEWHDQSSYMKIGIIGVIGFTTSSTTMSLWAESMHAQTSYLNQFFSCGGQEESEQETHKM